MEKSIISNNNSITTGKSGSDLFVLNERCLKSATTYHLSSSIGVQTGRPYIKGRTQINLYDEFKKEMVNRMSSRTNTIYTQTKRYCQALLGKSKFGDRSSSAITGANVREITVDTQ